MRDWKQCSATCPAVVLEPGGVCFAHADEDQRRHVLTGVSEGGEVKFLRGVTVSNDLFAPVIEAAPRDDTGRAILHEADLRRRSSPIKPALEAFVSQAEPHFTSQHSRVGQIFRDQSSAAAATAPS
jgi:hypothetical protein